MHFIAAFLPAAFQSHLIRFTLLQSIFSQTNLISNKQAIKLRNIHNQLWYNHNLWFFTKFHSLQKTNSTYIHSIESFPHDHTNSQLNLLRFTKILPHLCKAKICQLRMPQRWDHLCDTVDGSEIPNNHLTCMKPTINIGIFSVSTGAPEF